MNQKDLPIDLTLDYLQETPLGERFENIVPLVEKFQAFLDELGESDDPEDLAKKKVGTILALSALKKMADGRLPKDFTEEDWKDIAETVSAYAIDMDGKDYSALVFLLYAMWIDQTAAALGVKISKDRRDQILALSEELKNKSQQLRDGKIAEPAYVEDCLWIALEASLKIVSAFIAAATAEQVGDLAQAAAMLGFEYAHLKLLKKEQRLLTAYLENQKVLDQELQAEFEAYKAELQKNAEEFNELIEGAFDTDFREKLMGSVMLARAAGVREEEILGSVEEIDEFFM